MKIKIIGDGTLGGTQIVNAETGERLENVTSVTWHLDTKHNSMATLVFRYVAVEMGADVLEAVARFPSRRWWQIYMRHGWLLGGLCKRS